MIKNLSASAGNRRDMASISGLGRSSGVGKGTPLLSGKFHGQKSPVGYSPWGHKGSDMTE